MSCFLGYRGVNGISCDHTLGNGNLFATLEVGNSQMRTDIAYKNPNPTWNKTFCL